MFKQSKVYCKNFWQLTENNFCFFLISISIILLGIKTFHNWNSTFRSIFRCWKFLYNSILSVWNSVLTTEDLFPAALPGPVFWSMGLHPLKLLPGHKWSEMINLNWCCVRIFNWIWKLKNHQENWKTNVECNRPKHYQIKQIELIVFCVLGFQLWSNSKHCPLFLYL